MRASRIVRRSSLAVFAGTMIGLRLGSLCENVKWHPQKKEAIFFSIFFADMQSVMMNEVPTEVWCIVNASHHLWPLDVRLELDTEPLNSYQRKVVYEFLRPCAHFKIKTMGRNNQRLRRMRITLDKTHTETTTHHAWMPQGQVMILRPEHLHAPLRNDLALKPAEMKGEPLEEQTYHPHAPTGEKPTRPPH